MKVTPSAISGTRVGADMPTSARRLMVIYAITAFPHLAHNTWGGKGELALFSDLGPTGINKKHAIEVLLDYLKLGKEDTISFGDAKVDLSMFECCGFNVAMGNGGKEIKEAADYITDDVNEDGLYNAFKYLKLI